MTLLQRFGPSRRLTIDPEAALGGEHARGTGRSWWSLLYTDGRVVHEWDIDRSSPNGHRDWPRMAMLGQLKHVRALRLFCPNAQFAELGADGDQSGRLFQFKVAVQHLPLGGNGAGAAREMLAHVIGQLTGLDGECRLYAWDLMPEPPPPPGCPPVPLEPRASPLDGKQPLWYVQEEQARYDRELAAWRAYQQSPGVRDWMQQRQAWLSMGRGRLLGPIEDNVYHLRFHQLGRLNADHLGIADGEGR